VIKYALKLENEEGSGKEMLTIYLLSCWTNLKSRNFCFSNIQLPELCTIYNMSGRVVSDIQPQAEGEWL
jgi:hypothetical protein